MSMTTYMIWQMIGMFCAYFGVTLILPLVVFRRLLKGKSIINQMLFSFLIGNFYIVTMVQILQLLKISYAVTLILATVIPAYIVWVKLNKVPVGEVAENVSINVKRVTEKHMGAKTAGYRMAGGLKKKVVKLLKYCMKVFKKNYADILLQLFLLGILIWCYGKGMVQIYGYSASDLPVHNYWINAMNKNNIFVAGVYPHAYHCILYYLHKVFGFETYVLLSLFSFVQVTSLSFVLLYFLKLCCKAKFIPYVGVFIYSLGGFFAEITYSRFSAPLPQEYGMIFILPCAYYGFEFFKLRSQEVKAGEKKKDSWFSLFGFAMSFGMTLSAHFYNTIIAGVFCLAIAIGYGFWFVKKQYFANVVLTCMISVFVAIFPMVLAFATGTPLEGSLYWARSVIVGSQEAEVDDSQSVTQENNVSDVVMDNKIINNDEIRETVVDNPSVEMEGSQQNNLVTTQMKPTQKTLSEKIGGIGPALKQKYDGINSVMGTFVWKKGIPWCSTVIWIAILMLFVEGTVYFVLRKTCHGAMLVSVAIFMIFMMLILASDIIGVIKLMDYARACVYYAYMVPISVALAIDGLLYLVIIQEYNQRIREVVSAICLAGVFVFMLGMNFIRTPYKGGMLETNEAITCLTNILHGEKDFTWTICSANDELRMCEERGYHYETITMLRQMENWNKDSVITIPTSKVFFFIEKRPSDYGEGHENSGELVSTEAASRKISYHNGLTPYKGENRWITMSKMYYWAQEFMRMYPNEMKIYLETDKFVCYVLEQNTHNLYNLAIDYGYNTKEQ